MAHDTAPTPTRVIVRIYAGLLVAILAVVALVAAFGLPALALIGVVATLLVFAVIIAFSAGG